jgi:hypothetical protein
MMQRVQLISKTFNSMTLGQVETFRGVFSIAGIHILEAIMVNNLIVSKAFKFFLAGVVWQSLEAVYLQDLAYVFVALSTKSR